MTARKPAAEKRPAPAITPASVADCRKDYEAGADTRRKFDATAKRQHRR